MLKPLADLHFDLVGYGCTTCIGNSGPLPAEVSSAVSEGQLVAAAVLSGNRNFEGRVHPQVRANYLASPPLVVAYALAGTVDIDLATEPLGKGKGGAPVYLKDIWPTQAEVTEAVSHSVSREMFAPATEIPGTATKPGMRFRSQAETFTPGRRRPPNSRTSVLYRPTREPGSISEIKGARVLAMLGDSVTTDHISPAGDIPLDGPAGRFLAEHKVTKKDFNSFGSRRGNDRVMVRGTFANIRLKNLLVPGTEGGITLHFPDGEKLSIYDAAMRYRNEKVPLIILAGKEYGSGSSRGLGGKGNLASRRARGHCGNLRAHSSQQSGGHGSAAAAIPEGENAASLGLTGQEV